MAAQWRGIDEARRQFAKLPQVVRDAANDAVDATRKVAVAAARDRVPVRTGRLKKAIGHRLDKRRAKATVFVKSFYAHLVEYGTVHSNAKPFMTPAAELARMDFEGRAKSVGTQVERNMANIGGQFL